MAVDTLPLARPRGVEHAALWALRELGLPELLESLGINPALRDAALGSVVARMAFPASERATHRWLRERSAAGGLLGVDFETSRTLADVFDAPVCCGRSGGSFTKRCAHCNP